MIQAIYDEEEQAVLQLFPNACLTRTSHGAAWAMPCCLDKGHEGECRFIYDGRIGFNITVVQDGPDK